MQVGVLKRPLIGSACVDLAAKRPRIMLRKNNDRRRFHADIVFSCCANITTGSSRVSKTSPQLVIDALRSLIAGRMIRGDLPSYGELERFADASPATIGMAIARLRKEGYLTKHENGRGHAITVPGRLQNPALDRLVDELESAAAATNVPYEEVVALLASRMLIRGDWSDDRPEILALIRSAVEAYRRLNHEAPTKTSRRSPSKRELAMAALEELEGTHPTD